MKTGRLITWLSLLGFIFLANGIKPVQAADTYKINQYQTQVNVQSDGSAQVEQRIRFKIEDDINGIYINQDLSTKTGKTKQLEQPQISVNQQAFTAGGNQAGQYELTNDQQVYRFKLYQPATDGDTLNVVLKYRLTNLIINYRDTAELNWRVIGTGWDSDLDNVAITIQLPKKLAKDQLKSWTHGDLAGQQVVDAAKGQVKIMLDSNPANQMLESHLIFPTSVTATNPNRIDQNKRAAILKAEKALAEKANRQRQMQRKMVVILSVILVVIAPIGIWLIARHVKKALPKQSYSTNHPEHVYELPDENGPAVVQYLLNYPGTKDTKTDSLSATILDLVARRHLAIKEVPATTGLFHKNKVTYQIQLIDQTQLTQSEQSLVHWLFDIIGDQRQVTLEQVEAYPKKHNQERFLKAYKAWQTAVQEEAVQTGWLLGKAQSTVTYVTGWLVVSVVLLVASIGGSLIGLLLPWPILSSVILVGYCAWQLKHLKLWSTIGDQKRYEWLGFKQMLKDITSLDMAAVTDVILWDRYLSYATAFGVADRVIKALKVQFSTEVIATMPLGYYYGGFYGVNMGQSFNQALDHSFSTAFSVANATSASGGSGGFSGGSSGGFGGGSGGGTF
ncbi:DUF2207 family protein [Latilactobacillus fuchuensis]|uniref:DUF2207 family protein n=1 Tax=Latilactobacillus fuchuensis TaxID=164393 RepID=UPI0039AFA8B3